MHTHPEVAGSAGFDSGVSPAGSVVDKQSPKGDYQPHPAEDEVFSARCSIKDISSSLIDAENNAMYMYHAYLNAVVDNAGHEYARRKDADDIRKIVNDSPEKNAAKEDKNDRSTGYSL